MDECEQDEEVPCLLSSSEENEVSPSDLNDSENYKAIDWIKKMPKLLPKGAITYNKNCEFLFNKKTKSIMTCPIRLKLGGWC